MKHFWKSVTKRVERNNITFPQTAIAQLAERTAFNRVVEGSSPSGGVTLLEKA